MSKRIKLIEAYICPLFIISALCFYGKVVDESSICGNLIFEKILSFFANYYCADKTISYILFYIILVYFLYNTSKYLKKKISIIIYALFNAFIFTIGKSFMASDNLYLITHNYGQLLVSGIAFIGYFILFYVLLCLLLTFFDNYTTKGLYFKTNKLKTWIFDTYPVIGCSIVLFILWSPYLICYFPGILQYDGYEQIKMYYGLRTWTTHHPIYSTLLMGILMDLGKYLGSDKLGVFIYTFPQSIIFIFTLSYSFIYMKRWNISYKLRLIFLLFFGLLPIFPMYAYTEIKDTINYIFLLWLLYILIDVSEQKNINNFQLIQLFFTVILLCLSRNENKLILICTLIPILIYKDKICKNWLRFLYIILLGIFIAIVGNKLLVSANSIEKGRISETLSIPVQQTARYLKYHKADVTSEEYSELQRIFVDINLGDIYEPDKSDAVKAKFKDNLTISELIIYGKIWGKHLFRHPDCYFSAFFNSTYGYFYPEQPEFYGFGFATENINSEMNNYVKEIDIQFEKTFDIYRNILYKWIELLRYSSITSYLFHPGTYVSLFILALFLIFYYKLYNHLLIYCIPLITLLVCCLSPLNGSIRYSLSIICGLPLFSSSTIQQIVIRKTEDK